MSQPHQIFCICTDGQSLIGIPFCVPVDASLTSNSTVFFKAVVKEAQENHKGSPGFPQLSAAVCKLWKLKNPCSNEDISNESKFSVVTILHDSTSHVVQIQSSPVKISEYFSSDLLTAHPDDYHILLQVPRKTKPFRRSQASQVIKETHFKQLADCAAINVPETHKDGTSFQKDYLTERYNGLKSNDVSEFLSSTGKTSMISNELPEYIRNLVKDITSPFKIIPWPSLSIPDEAYKQLGNKKPNPEVFLDAFEGWRSQYNTTSVQGNGDVSFNILFRMPWIWMEKIRTSESEVHAFVTYPVGACTSRIFGDRITVISGTSLTWSVILRKPDSNVSDPEGNKKQVYLKYDPRPDFAVLVDKFPFLVMEICSDPSNEADRYRMLLYSAYVLRCLYWLFIKDLAEKEAKTRSQSTSIRPFVVACYIKQDVATLYILFIDSSQPSLQTNAPKKPSVKFTQDEYKLSNGGELYSFLTRLYALIEFAIGRCDGWNKDEPFSSRAQGIIDKIATYAKPLPTAPHTPNE